jgi:CheY-like chemotaxis protein
MERDVRVLAVDDQEVFLRACARLVGATDGFCWAGGVTSGVEALQCVDDLAPDLVLMDVRMPGLDGVETTRRLVKHHVEIVVVLVSVAAADDLPVAVRTSGAVTHVRKHALSPHALQRIWASHGVRDAAAPHRRPSSPDPAG